MDQHAAQPPEIPEVKKRNPWIFVFISVFFVFLILIGLYIGISRLARRSSDKQAPVFERTSTTSRSHFTAPATTSLPVSQTPDEVVSQLLTFIKNNNQVEVGKLISSKAISKNITNLTPLYGQSFVYTITSTYVETQGTIAIITVQITLNGQTSFSNFTMLKEEENWLLVDYENLPVISG